VLKQAESEILQLWKSKPRAGRQKKKDKVNVDRCRAQAVVADL
jgi:hypothetical protein